MNENNISQICEEVICLDEKVLKDLNNSYCFIKRICDIIIAIIGCILLLPVGIIVKIACILNNDYEPILFKQKRIGKDGREIYIYKFRSMVSNADKVLEELLKNDDIRTEYKRFKKLKNDPRITKVGRYIRKTSIDELPQFINVLKGEMSVVGPRPYLFREQEDMGEYYENIIGCKPGITGYWQVNGRSGTDFIKRLVMDEYYFKYRGFALDIKIFFKTFIKVANKDGAK